MLIFKSHVLLIFLTYLFNKYVLITFNVLDYVSFIYLISNKVRYISDRQHQSTFFLPKYVSIHNGNILSYLDFKFYFKDFESV